MNQTDALPQLGPLRTQRDEASSPYLPTWRAEQLAKAKTKDVRMALANNLRCAPEALRIMQADRCLDVRALVAQHRNCPQDVLDVLAEESEFDIRLHVATHPNTSAEVLSMFAQGRVISLQNAAVANENCPRATLVAVMENARAELVSTTFLWDRSAALRELIVKHPNYARNDLLTLQDPANSVREAAAANPTSGDALLRALWLDHDYGVRARLTKNPACPGSVLREAALSANDHLISQVAANANTPPEVWVELLPDLSEAVRYILAAAAHTPAMLLARLAHDPHSLVRTAVSTHKHTPAKVLWELRNDEPEIIARAVSNPNCSPELLELVAASLQSQTKTPADTQLVEALASQDLPSALWELVHAVAQRSALEALTTNERCPPAILDSLANGSDSQIAERARHLLRVLEIRRERIALVEKLTAEASNWQAVVAPHGRDVEQVAWSLVCNGFSGSLQTLAEVAQGAVV